MRPKKTAHSRKT
jgi:hypothetical protein